MTRTRDERTTSGPRGATIHSPARRRFLRGAAALGVGSTTMAMLGNLAQSGEGQFPLRFFFMFTGNGHLTEHYVPANPSETGFDLRGRLERAVLHRGAQGRVGRRLA